MTHSIDCLCRRSRHCTWMQDGHKGFPNAQGDQGKSHNGQYAGVHRQFSRLESQGIFVTTHTLLIVKIAIRIESPLYPLEVTPMRRVVSNKLSLTENPLCFLTFYDR